MKQRWSRVCVLAAALALIVIWVEVLFLVGVPQMMK